MRAATGDAAGSVTLVDEVLAADAGHVGALKLRASWLIDTDRPAEAVTALRSALAEAPQDAEILMLMGDAHDRDGAHELAGDSYARAVEASGRAPAESLFYAQFLLQDGRPDSAAAVLGDALQRAPGDVDLLAAMARIRLQAKDVAAATAIVATLRGLGQPRAEAAARAIEAESLLRQDRVDDTITYLQDLTQTGTGNGAATARMVQLQLETGKLSEARAVLDAQLAAKPGLAAPDLAMMRFLRAGLHVLENEPGKAEAIYRDLLAATPAAEPPLRALYSLLQTDGRTDDAAALLVRIRAIAPDAPLPRLLQAAAAEAAGDFDGAIAIYDALYALDSGNLVVANNLASLLATHRADADSLARATTIAKRLRGSQVPAFQDTYGWLQTRAGNPTEGLVYLEPAAAGLPQDAMVQVHLGMTYLALGRTNEARRLLDLALALAGDSTLPAFVAARTALDGLGAP
jgi:cellulose synthase operon protein C